MKYWSQTQLQIYLDDQIICHGHTNGAANTYETISCGASVFLDNNQKVFVKLTNGKVHAGYYNIFTGILVSPKN